MKKGNGLYDLIRLRKSEIDAIIRIFLQHFEKSDHLWIFGSRIDKKKRGGDIDLYMESHSTLEEINEKKIKFLVSLKNEIGEQKIDLVVRSLLSEKILAIHKEAKETGVQLV